MPATTCSHRTMSLNHSVSTASTTTIPRSVRAPRTAAGPDDRCAFGTARARPMTYCMDMAREAKSTGGGVALDAFGVRIMALADRLAQWSESSDGLTCTYLSGAHRAVAAQICDWLRQAGLAAEIDAVGNVVGRYAAADAAAKTLILASHYDPVRNAGKYDGRLGALTAHVLAEHRAPSGRKLPFHLDVIAFSEEEGVRFASSFLGSSALAGRFDQALLERRDADGHALAAVMCEAGLDPEKIP